MQTSEHTRFQHLTDQQLVEALLAVPPCEDAAVYLIYDRYAPLCRAVTNAIFDGDLSHLDELQSELFILLKGKNLDWHSLRNFHWDSSLGYWLRIMLRNLALHLKAELIENDGLNISIDWAPEADEEAVVPSVEISVDEEPDQERRFRMMLLQKTIARLENPDQRQVVVWRLEGYSSKETAALLAHHWQQQGIVPRNKAGEPIVPDSGYIDNLFKRGYDRVKQYFRTLDQ